MPHDNQLTLSNRSYNSPTVCFSFPFTQLTQTPGPSMTLFPQTGVPSCVQPVRRECLSITYSQYPSQSDIAFWVSHRLPEDVWRLTLPIQRNSAYRTVQYRTVSGIVLRYLSATGPRAGKFALDLMNCCFTMPSVIQYCGAHVYLPLENWFSLPPGYAIP